MRGMVLIHEASEAISRPSLYSQLCMDDGVVLSEDDAKKILAQTKSYSDYTIDVAVSGATVMRSIALLIMDNLVYKGASLGVVEDVIVHKGWRGKGVGQTIMGKAMYLRASKGCCKLAFTPNKLCIKAPLFFKTAGFGEHISSYSVPIGKINTARPRDEAWNGASS